MRTFSILAVALLATNLTGCGEAVDAGHVDVYPVSGTVTLFGAPLAGATVAFAPAEGQPTAVGTTDSAGKFQLTTYEFGDGAAPGVYKVVVSKTVAKSGASVKGGEGADHEANYSESSSHDASSEEAAAALVPANYSSSSDTPLSADVKSSGENNFTFPIE